MDHRVLCQIVVEGSLVFMRLIEGIGKGYMKCLYVCNTAKMGFFSDQFSLLNV